MDDFSIALGKLFKWLKMALDTRINDVISRIQEKEKERAIRQEAVEREEERLERRNEALEDAKAAWEEALEAANEENEDEDEGEKK